MAMRRRRPPGPALRPELVDWLLLGHTAPGAGTPEYDPFLEFDEAAYDLPALWAAHREALIALAASRGIGEPWGRQFEDPAVAAAWRSRWPRVTTGGGTS